MIFGEYLGEVVSNGEYEVRAQGTTVASLKIAVDALTDEEYFDSFLWIATDKLVSITNPIYPSTDRCYERTIGWNSSITIVQSLYYNNSTVAVRFKAVDNVNNVTKMTNILYATNDSTNPLSLTSWKLYTRKQTLAIPGAGDDSKHIVVGVEEKIGTININGTTYDRYRKVISGGMLPNINTKNFAHGISGAVGFLSVSGVAFRSDGGCRTLPTVFLNGGTTGNVQVVDCYIFGTDIYIVTNANFNSYTSSYITVEYYK